MVDFVVFNELSLPFNTNIDIEKKFIDFFKIFNVLEKKNLTKIRMDEDFKNYLILKDISLPHFFGQLKDTEVKDRLREFIANGIIKIETPLIRDEDIEEAIANEYFYKGQSTLGGLACCDIWNTIAISFNSSDEWDTDIVILQKNKIDISINHASKVEDLDAHEEFFNELKKYIKLGITQSNFWNRREEFFPKKIVFCKEIEKQIKALDKHIFIQAINILRDIESGQESVSKNRYTPESSSVKNNTKKSNERMFTINDKKVYFENHITFSSQKIYFLEENNKIYIGYIGKHLSTKKY